MSDSATPWTTAHQASLLFTVSLGLFKLMPVESVMPSNHCIFCHPLLLLFSVFPSISVFSSESALLIRWPKYWSFSFSISPFNECSGLISFRINWFDLLAVKELSRVFSNTAVWKHQFFGTQPSLWSPLRSSKDFNSQNKGDHSSALNFHCVLGACDYPVNLNWSLLDVLHLSI